MGALLTACAGGPAAATAAGAASPAVLSLDADAWATISDPDNFPLANDGTALAFDFPVDAGSMNYLYNTRPPASIGGAVSVSLQVTTTGEAVFNYMTEPFNTCQTPATVRPFIWANRNGSGDSDRWWPSTASYTLAEGSAVLSIPLTPDKWSNVAGKSGSADRTMSAAFTGATGNVSSLGLTFGGGCFFGHGVNVRGGTARFILRDYRIQ